MLSFHRCEMQMRQLITHSRDISVRSWSPLRPVGNPMGPDGGPQQSLTRQQSKPSSPPLKEAIMWSSGSPQWPMWLTKTSARGQNVDKPCSLYTWQEYSGTLALWIVTELLCFSLICQHISLRLSKRWRQKLNWGRGGNVYGKSNTIAKVKWLVCTRAVYIMLNGLEILHMSL